MNDRFDIVTERVLTIFRIEIDKVYNRIKERSYEAVHVFAANRTRAPFQTIFDHRYNKTNVSEIVHCSSDLIVALEKFFTEVDSIKWYLDYTQDMPGTVRGRLDQSIRELGRSYEMASVLIKAELSVHKDD